MRLKFSPRVTLLAIFLFAFAYRLYRLGAASLWYDETVSLYLAQLDLVSLTRHTAGDIHPPFYYYLLHFWGQFAGWSEFSSAFLSLFFGILIVALVYRAAHDWLNVRAALIAAFLVAISPYHLGYSQEVRMYTLGAFLGLASVFLFARILSQPSAIYRPQKLLSRAFIAYAIVSALGMYTLYYFAFLLVFENLAAIFWLVFRSQVSNQRSRIILWLSSQLAILILFLPWLPTAFKQATDPPVPPWRTFVSLPNVLLESFSALALGQSVDWQTPSWVWIVLLIVTSVIIAALLQFNAERLALDPLSLALAACTGVPLIIIYALSLWKPLYHVRYIFIYSPAFYILLASGISKILNYKFLDTRRFWRLTICVVFFTVFVSASAFWARNFWFDPQYAEDDLRGAVKRISENWRPGDAVLINAGYTYPAFLYYFDETIAWRGRLSSYQSPFTGNGAVVLQTGSIGGNANLGWNSPESDFYATTADETRAALDRVFAAHPRIWMLRLYDTVVDPDGSVRDYFAQHARLIDDQVFTGWSNTRAQGYLTTQTPLTLLPSTVTRREILLGNRITFLGFEPAQLTVRAGEPIDVNLYWRAKETTNVDARVEIRLFGEDGKLAAATDELPLGNGLGTSRWDSAEIMREPVRLTVPTARNLLRGNYVLRIQMVNPLTNEPLPAEKSEWVAEDSQIRIMTVRIE